MHFLSIEPSTKIFSLAVSRGDKVLRWRNLASGKVLEDSIIPAVDRILKSAGVKFKQLDAFAIGLGPGSFTSLRVGLSTVKAFCLGSGKPVVGVCSLDVIAEGVRHIACDEICVIVDARRNLLYSALYKNTKGNLKRQGDCRLTDLGTLLDSVHGRTLFVGDGVGLYRAEIKRACACTPLFAPEKFWFPQAKHLAKLAFERLERGKYDDAGKLVPIYLYASDCQVRKP